MTAAATMISHATASHPPVQPESHPILPTHQEPSARELFLLVLVSAAIFFATCSVLHGWRSLILNYGDNDAYLAVANAIRHWNFQGIGVQHFMGFPYFIAIFALLFHMPPSIALCFVATAASLCSVFLVARLFGTWVAAYFALTNFTWLQVSFLGGSEPLAVALVFGAFWLFQRERWFLASLLASLAVTVRPLMIFALVGMGFTLLYRKRYRPFAVMFVTGLVIGALYVLPLALYFGDPLLTVHSYTTRDYGAAQLKGPHGHLFGWPLHGIIVGTILYPGPWTNLGLTFFWIILVLVGTCVMIFSKTFREYAMAHPAETIFCGLYLLSIFSYDYLAWARSAFMRFCIPTLPFIFLALLRYLPKYRYVLWALAITSPLAAALSAVGIRNVLRIP